MPPTIISKKASNWVDRGESPVPTMRRVLDPFFEPFDETELDTPASEPER